jgi:hypothetical protein
MRTAILSASFLNFDTKHVWDPQPADIFRYDENSFPLRKAITPHFQSKIPKVFGWQMNPGYDFYIYVDASYIVKDGFTDYMLKELGDCDIAVFLHPFNKTIENEYRFLKDRSNHKYILKRYSGEFIEEQYKVITDDKTYIDNLLLHAAIFAYRDNERVRSMMKEWWYYISRYHLCDQLSFPYVLKKSDCSFKLIPKLIGEIPYVQYVRHNG